MMAILISLAAVAQPADVVTSFQPLQPGSPRVEWAQLPTQGQINASMPEDGSGPHFAAISCHAGLNGTLAECAVMPGVTSPGGYGAAAMSFATKFQLARASIPPAGTIVTVVMRFGDL